MTPPIAWRLSPQLALHVDDLCSRFEKEWTDGGSPRLEDFLVPPDAPEYAVLVQELILLDSLYRRRRGETPSTTDYLRRFLDLDAHWLEEQLEKQAGLEDTATVAADLGQSHEEPPKTARLGDYQLLEELGRGGMGVVYKARHVNLKRLAAIKMVLGGPFASAEQLTRFRREAEAVARMQHPNIVQIFEVGERPGTDSEGPTPFLALEYVEGGSLSQRLGGQPLPAREAATLVETLAQAVQAAHAKGLVHRDLKPANVLLTQDGTPKIADFGLAKQANVENQTHTGQALGTPSYMAPEQAAGRWREVGPAADIYALGAILYELFTGRPPFRAATVLDTLDQVRTQEPVRPRQIQPKTPRDLETICLKCLHKEPRKRYASAQELAEDLGRFLGGQPVQARPTGRLERGWRWCRRNPVVASLAALTLILLVTLTAGSVIAVFRIDAARQTADQKTEDEKAARQKADAATMAAQQRLVRLNQVTGNFMNDAGDFRSALLRYTQAWMLDRDDPASEPIHRLRLACVLERCPRLEGICFHTSAVLEAQANSDASRVLTRTEEGRAFLWNPYRSEPIAAPLPHTGKVLCSALSADGTRAVTTGTDKTARLWDTATGQPLGIPLQHPDVVNRAAYSPDGNQLATACNDGTVRFWTVPEGKLLDQVIRLGSAARFVGFSPTGKLVVTVDGQNMACVWDRAAGKPLTPPLPHKLIPGNAPDRLFQPPLFSPDGQRILTADDHILRVSDASGDVKPRVTVAYPVINARFSPDGGRILLVGRTSVAVVVDTASGTTILELQHPREVQAGCFSRDGQVVATASTGGLIHVRDASSGKSLATPFGHIANLTDLAFTPEGNRLLSVSQDGTVRVWAVRFQPFQPLPYDYSCGRAHRLTIAGRCLSPDGAWELLNLGKEKGARLRARASGKPDLALAHPGLVRWFRFAPDGRTVYTADERTLQVWDAGSGQQRGPLVQIKGPLIHSDFSDDGSRLMLVEADGTVTVRNTSNGRFLGNPVRLTTELQSRRAYHIRRVVALSPDGRHLAVHFPGPVPHETWVYEVDTGNKVQMGIRFEGVLAALAFSPDSKRLVTAQSDSLARVWDVETGKSIGPPMRHPSFVRLATFGSNGRLVLTNDDGNIRLWDSATGDKLTPPLPHPLGWDADFWFSRDGGRIVGLSENGAVRQWQLPAFRTDTDRVSSLVHLLTGHQVDAGDAIVPLDEAVFRDNPEEFRQAWLSWRGREAGPGAMTRQGVFGLNEFGLVAKWDPAQVLLDLYVNPLDGAAHMRLGTLLVQAKKLELGHAHLRVGLGLGPPRPAFQNRRILGAFQRAAEYLVTQQRWKDASDDLMVVANGLPQDSSLPMQVGALRIMSKDRAGHERLCRWMLEQFGNTGDPYAADRTLKACLMAREAIVDDRLARLAQIVIERAQGHNDLPYFEFSRGLYEYRKGQYAAAQEWFDRSRKGCPASDIRLDALDRIFIAMVHHHLGRKDEGERLLASTSATIEEGCSVHLKRPGVESWHDWLFCKLAFDEATALFQRAPAPMNK